jgi:hypothetical protein
MHPRHAEDEGEETSSLLVRGLSRLEGMEVKAGGRCGRLETFSTGIVREAPNPLKS